MFTFSMGNTTANACGVWLATNNGGRLTVKIEADELIVDLNLHGLHNAINAMTAISIADTLNKPRSKIIKALSEFR